MGIRLITTESEKALEKKLVDGVKQMGGEALKFTSQFHRGIPDRIVLLPFHTFAFVELKTTGEKPTKLQIAEMVKLERMGYHVFVVDSTESLEYFFGKMQARLDKMAQNQADHAARIQESIDKLMQKFGSR